MKNRKNTQNTGETPVNAEQETASDAIATTNTQEVAVPKKTSGLHAIMGIFNQPEVTVPTVYIATKGSGRAKEHGVGSLVTNTDDLLAEQGESRTVIPVSVQYWYQTDVEQDEEPEKWDEWDEVPWREGYHQTWGRKADGKYVIRLWRVGMLVQVKEGEMNALPKVKDPNGDEWYVMQTGFGKPHMGRNFAQIVHSNAEIELKPPYTKAWDLSIKETKSQNGIEYVTPSAKFAAENDQVLINWIEGIV